MSWYLSLLRLDLCVAVFQKKKKDKESAELP